MRAIEKYNPAPGEWVQPLHRAYFLECCDCGLVHRFQFRVHKSRVQMRAWRETRLTTAARKRKGVKIIREIS